MIELPDFEEAFSYENNFYLSCDITRLSKLLAHYEIFKIARDCPGEIVECGVFKGASIARFAMMRSLFGSPHSKKIIGFDIFDHFPEMEREDDIEWRERFIESTKGGTSISPEQLMEALEHKNVHHNVEFVAGDVCETVPAYAEEHPELKIALLNMDTGTYESSLAILEHFYPKVVNGGVVILDNYSTVAGETAAVDEYFAGRKVTYQKFPFSMTPVYLIKDQD